MWFIAIFDALLIICGSLTEQILFKKEMINLKETNEIMRQTDIQTNRQTESMILFLVLLISALRLLIVN